MESDYIVVLNNGIHYTDKKNAAKILDGVESGSRLVDAEIDFQGDGIAVIDVKLSVATIVMVYKAPSLETRTDELLTVRELGREP